MLCHVGEVPNILDLGTKWWLSGQLHALGKGLLICTEEGTGWAPLLVWMWWQRDFLSIGNLTMDI